MGSYHKKLKKPKASNDATAPADLAPSKGSDVAKEKMPKAFQRILITAAKKGIKMKGNEEMLRKPKKSIDKSNSSKVKSKLPTPKPGETLGQFSK
jgi:hypothetical protein